MNLNQTEAVRITTPTERNYSLDLLRVICMLMIPMLHLGSHGGMGSHFVTFSPEWFLTKLLLTLSTCAVNIFVMISGYFMVSKKISVKRLITTAGSIWFYSLVILLIAKLTGIMDVDMGYILSSIFSISFRNYWFPTCYLCLCLISPFLNKLLTSLSRKRYLAFVILLFVLLSLWGDLIPTSDPFNIEKGYSVSWFVFLYVLAGYVKLYGGKTSAVRAKGYALVYGAVTVLMLLVVSLLTYLSGKISLIDQYSLVPHFTRYCSVLTVLQSISLFLCFVNLRVKTNGLVKLISIISPLTFGVYLIHDNPLLRDFLYGRLLKTYALPQNMIAVLIMIGYALAIFAVCAAIEFLRRKMFLLWEGKAWFLKLCDKLQKKTDSYFYE